MESAEFGIIGGSGLYHLEDLRDVREVEIDTPFGAPSATVRVGTLGERNVAFISRHGSGHRLAPSEVPYAANIYALKTLGVRRVISVSAVGSLKAGIPPRSFVVPDNLIDRTVGRRRSFFDDGIVAHVSMADPYCPKLSAALAESASRQGGLQVVSGGTYVCIEGPQFSTRAESELFRSWGASIIGMTALPEARLAREAEMCYACLAMITDYDVWHDVPEDHVSVEVVVANLQAMTSAVGKILPDVIQSSLGDCDDACWSALENAIITDPDAITGSARERLSPIAGRYLNPVDHP